FFFSSRRRHTRFSRDWSSDVCSSDLVRQHGALGLQHGARHEVLAGDHLQGALLAGELAVQDLGELRVEIGDGLIERVHGASCGEVARASCRESGEIWVVAGAWKEERE